MVRVTFLKLFRLLTRRLGCNVGYAFVNFINVQDLLRFAKAKLGEKWSALTFSGRQALLTPLQEYDFERKSFTDELRQLSVRRILYLLVA
jgi:hypothetical protein